MQFERRGRRLGAPYPLPLGGSTPSQCEGDVAKRPRETAAVSGWLAVRRDGGGQNHSKIHGRAWKPAPTTGRRVDAPYAQIAFLFFNRNGQDRSLQFFIIHFSLFIHFRVVETPTPTREMENAFAPQTPLCAHAHIFVQNRLKMFKNAASLQNVAKL